MSITSAEGMAEQIVLTATRESLRISAQAARLSIVALAHILKGSLHLLSNSRLTPKALNDHGQVRLRTLQGKGGDVHAQEISPEILASLRKYLKKQGIDFAVERGAPDGKTYLHFQGKDVDAMRHAITQALARITPKRTRDEPNEPAPEQTTPAESTPPATETNDAPAREVVEPQARPTSPVEERPSKAKVPLSERLKAMPLRKALESRAAERAAAETPTVPDLSRVKDVKR